MITARFWSIAHLNEALLGSGQKIMRGF